MTRSGGGGTGPDTARRHSIEASEEGGVRFLHFGSEWVQGAMRIARPWSLELEYTREMAACLLLRTDAAWPRSVLQVGLGAASLTKFWYRHRPEVRQTVVEINPAVVAMAYQSFKLPRDAERIRIEVADGVAWMGESGNTDSKARPARFDCIMVDGYDQNARFGALGTESFYRDCRARLTRQGLLVLNLFGRSQGYRKQLDQLNRAFDGRVLALAPIEGGNAVAFAAAGDAIVLDTATLRAEAERVQAETGIKFTGTLVRLDQAIADLRRVAVSPGRAIKL